MDDAILIPLRAGKNAPQRVGALLVEPINFFVQTEPVNQRSPSVQLELSVADGGKAYTTWLWHDENRESQKINYPKAWGSHLFSLERGSTGPALVIEKLAFDKPFFIDLYHEARIDSFSVNFEQCVGEWSVDEYGNQTDAFNVYTILLSDGVRSERFSFTSLNKYAGNEHMVAWNTYRVLVTDDAEKYLAMKIQKNNQAQKE